MSSELNGTQIRKLLGIRLGVLYQHPPVPGPLPACEAIALPPGEAPSLAIVTPSFNQGPFLGRTVHSVLSQSYPNLQYVVQDGGSTDDSREQAIAAGLPESCYLSAPDKGQGDAINKGFARVTGDVMAYLNSDDLLLPGALALVANYFRQHPEVDAVYGNRVLIDEDDRLIGKWVIPYHSTQLLQWIDYVPQETLFWRRSLWEASGGRIDESFSYALDWDLLSRFIASRARFAHLPFFLGAFRIHSRQKTSSEYQRLGRTEMRRIRDRQPSGWYSSVSNSLRHVAFLASHIREHQRLSQL